MTKYLHEERFVVTSQDKDSLRKYAEGWERTFGEKPEPCFVCGATDHERIEVFGGTVQGCPQVPDNVLLAAPGTDAIECKLNSYANYIVQGPAVSIPVDKICEGSYDDGFGSTTCDNREGCGLPGCPANDFGVTPEQ